MRSPVRGAGPPKQERGPAGNWDRADLEITGKRNVRLDTADRRRREGRKRR